MTVRVKICGITNLEDARIAIACGADALGFMFYEPSPRHLTFAQAAEIIRQLPPFVSHVGVLVNPSAITVHEALQCGINHLQFHGEESLAFCTQFGVPTLKAFRIKDAASLAVCRTYPGLTWLLDSYVPGHRGGTGATFNWELARLARELNPYILLAGGLTPENIATAVTQVCPYGVDVSSGVESAPGKKDPAKMRAFIQAAKSAIASPA